MDSAAIFRALSQRVYRPRLEPGLQRIQSLLKLLGNPQNDFRSIHIAGTNGKTSTAFFAAALLQNLGLKVGLATSPHLVSLNERFMINGRPIDDVDLAEVYAEVLRVVELSGEPINFCEFVTAMTFRHFSNQSVDYAVVETGLGGRLDPTNVVNAEVSIILPIGIEHSDYLGTTLEEIAFEKAGIVKSGGRAVVSNQKPEARQIIETSIARVGATGLFEGEDFRADSIVPAVGGSSVSFTTAAARHPDVYLSEFGAHQVHNMIAATQSVETIFGPLDHKILNQSFNSIQIPGRFQLVQKNPPLWVDGAHNPDAIDAFAQTLAENFNFAFKIGIVSILSDKDAPTMLKTLLPLFEILILSGSSSPRALSPSELRATVNQIAGPSVPEPASASAPGNQLIPLPKILSADSIEQSVTLAQNLINQLVPNLADSSGIFLIGSLKAVGDLLAGRKIAFAADGESFSN
jgi:dihydrofolate synthase/folylpolyglutamate synthase